MNMHSPGQTFAWTAAPFLRPLIPPDEFDPNKSWKVLIGKAYSFQYGWDSVFLDEITYPFPGEGAVWVKVLDQTPLLESYYKDAGYTLLFSALRTPAEFQALIYGSGIRACGTIPML